MAAKLKKRKKKAGPPQFKFKRYFQSRQWVWWENSLGQKEVGTVICQNVETGKVRVRNETNGGELWLQNHQPTPLEPDEEAKYDAALGRVVILSQAKSA
jgi:hypothetical protein